MAEFLNEVTFSTLSLKLLPVEAKCQILGDAEIFAVC